ncbi:unnamed protein product, partial [Mesorhabditis spiculigera]
MDYRHIEAQQIIRMSREDQSQRTIRYPKCINSALLMEMDRERVKADLMLNCQTNIFVQLLGEEGMVMEPPPCDRYEDLRICSNRVQPVFDNSTLPAADVNYHFEVTISTVLLATFIALASLYCVYRKLTEWPAEPLPSSHVAANIALEDQILEDDWMDKFDHVISGKPAPRPRRGKLGFAHEGHIALQLRLLPNLPAGVPLEKQIISGTPDDALAIAKKYFNELAHGYYVSERNGMPRRTFDHAELQTLFDHARNIVKWTDGVARITGATWIIGDINGDFNALVRVFAAFSQKASPGQNMLFLGDIVDRGKRQLMSVVLIVSAYVLYPDKIFYVRGNHELTPVHFRYGFTQEVFDEGYTYHCIDAVRSFFQLLPPYALIDKRILAMHGGLCPEFEHELIRDGFDHTDDQFEDLIRGTLWSDPNHQQVCYGWNHRRNLGYYFGHAAIQEVREKLGIDFIVRGHQKLNTGMRFFGDWLISLHTTGFRSPSKTPEQLKLERSFSPEGTAARKKIIAEAGAEPEIGGVLVYDGRKFKMIHLIPVHRYYRAHEHFAFDFDQKMADERVFVHNVNKPFKFGWPRPTKSASTTSTSSTCSNLGPGLFDDDVGETPGLLEDEVERDEQPEGNC